MPSRLLKKLSSRRRSRRHSLPEKGTAQQMEALKMMPASAPFTTISIDHSSSNNNNRSSVNDLVSPLKSPTTTMRRKSSTATNGSMPSLALSEGASTAFSFRSSDSWSDGGGPDSPPSKQQQLQQVVEEAPVDYGAMIRERDPTKIIPPRPSQSRWDEADFLKTVWAWDLPQAEIDMLRELEVKLYDVTHWKNNPFEVVRFMKGPQGYKPAEKLFRKMVDWRIKENVDTILEDYQPPQVLLDYTPSAILYGLDHDGDPVYLERAGVTDIASLLKKFGHKFMIRHMIWLREMCGRGEWIKDHEERMGRPITQVTIVYDLAGLSTRHMRPGVLPFFGHLMRLTQDNYTGPVKRMVIIQAPSIFRAVWGIVKNFFDPWAVAKMTFSGPNDYEEALSRFMDLSILPPAVCPKHGRGRAAAGLPQRFEGGIPHAYDYTESIAIIPGEEDEDGKLIETKSSISTTSSTAAESSSEEDYTTSTRRGSVSASTLGSGFFHMDGVAGQVYISPVA